MKQQYAKMLEEPGDRKLTKELNSFTGAIKGFSAPDAEDLAAINSRYALTPLKADDIMVAPVYLANNQWDRDDERFSEPTLKRFNETLPGKSFIMAHQWGPPGVGRFYKSQKIEQENGQWLVGHIYTVKELHDQLIKEINAGVWWAVSIGFRWAKIAPIGTEGKTLTRDEALENPASVRGWEFQEDPEHGLQSEALEGSLVYLGAQTGAAMGQISKSVQPGGNDRLEKEYKIPDIAPDTLPDIAPVQTETKETTMEIEDKTVDKNEDNLDTKEMTVLLGGMTKAISALNDQIVAQAETGKATATALADLQKRLDEAPARKGAAQPATRIAEPEDGFLKIPIRKNATCKVNDEVCDKFFEIDPETLAPTEDAMKAFMQIVGLKEVDMEKEAWSPNSAKTIHANLVKAFTLMENLSD
jgi:hypothetical protein